MTAMSPEDYVAISNLLGRYQWLVDEGHADEWAALWLEDGVFIGGAADRRGHEQLRAVPRQVKDSFDGRMRHHMGSFHVEYDATRDEACAQYYNFVTTWTDAGAAFFTMALCTLQLVRHAATWRIKSNTTQRLLPGGV